MHNIKLYGRRYSILFTLAGDAASSFFACARSNDKDLKRSAEGRRVIPTIKWSAEGRRVIPIRNLTNAASAEWFYSVFLSPGAKRCFFR